MNTTAQIKSPPYAREVIAVLAAGGVPNVYIFAGPDAWERAQRRRAVRGPGAPLSLRMLPGLIDWSFLRGHAVILHATTITPANRAKYVALTAEMVGAGIRFVAVKATARKPSRCERWSVQHEHSACLIRSASFGQCAGVAFDESEITQWCRTDRRSEPKTRTNPLVMAGVARAGQAARARWRTGTGKTTLAIDIAACVSAGRALPSDWRPPRGNVLVWSGGKTLDRYVSATSDRRWCRSVQN